ncbi:MAG: MBL fold metallo-hydrolase [Flavobacterium sp.]|nr:MBL fold metallo-hydrolase [Flavobacterium sp.]
MVEPLFCNTDDRSIVYRFVSDLFHVCTYFVVDDEKVIIVDPGKMNDDVYEWLLQFNEIDKIIYITHEHFDHHFDVNLMLRYPRTSVCFHSDNFASAILNTRKNLSHYYNMPVETTCNQISIFNYFHVIATPGHSELSYCFRYKNLLFGGDTVIEKEYLVLKLPGSDKAKFKESVLSLRNNIEINTVVLPGHGNVFCFDKWII